MLHPPLKPPPTTRPSRLASSPTSWAASVPIWGRRPSGELTEDEFKMRRLQNGVYLQVHAYMCRVAIPYGTLSTKQLRALAHVARRWDRGYGHFTTRQNIQYNWIKLAELPDALEYLAGVGIHA